MRKKTLRRLGPKARQLAKIYNTLDSARKKLKNLLPIVDNLEIDANILKLTDQIQLNKAREEIDDRQFLLPLLEQEETPRADTKG